MYLDQLLAYVSIDQLLHQAKHRSGFRRNKQSPFIDGNGNDAAENAGMRFLQEYAAEIKLPMDQRARMRDQGTASLQYSTAVVAENFGARGR